MLLVIVGSLTVDLGSTSGCEILPAICISVRTPRRVTVIDYLNTEVGDIVLELLGHDVFWMAGERGLCYRL